MEDTFNEALMLIRRHREEWTSTQRQKLVIAITQGQADEILGPPKVHEKREDEGVVPGVTMIDVLRWKETWAQTKTLPNHLAVVSYLCYQEAGITPFGTMKAWASACHDLWEAAGQDPEVVLSAAIAGNKARKDEHITISSPRSLVNYARSIRAGENRPGKAILI